MTSHARGEGEGLTLLIRSDARWLAASLPSSSASLAVEVKLASLPI